MFKRLLLTSLLFVLSNQGFATCLGIEPIYAVKQFYNNHQDFYYAKPSRNKGILSSRLNKALSKEYWCKQGEVCALESSPWTDAQEGTIKEPKTFKLIFSRINIAEVTMNYQFSIDPVNGITQSVKVKLIRKNNQRCWVVYDFVTPNGSSVLNILETWQEKYLKSSKAFAG